MHIKLLTLCSIATILIASTSAKATLSREHVKRDVLAALKRDYEGDDDWSTDHDEGWDDSHDWTGEDEYDDGDDRYRPSRYRDDDWHGDNRHGDEWRGDDDWRGDEVWRDDDERDHNHKHHYVDEEIPSHYAQRSNTASKKQ